MEKILNRIDCIQKQKNLTNEYISNQLDISENYYNKLLSGKAEIKLSMLNKIASILDVELHKLFQ